MTIVISFKLLQMQSSIYSVCIKFIIVNSFGPEPHKAVRIGARVATDKLDVVAIACVKGVLGLDSGSTHTIPVVVQTWPIFVKNG